MNEFSVVCRILGSLFYRSPQDTVLDPLFALISEGKLKQHWPLEQDELLDRLAQDSDRQVLEADYQAMFAAQGSVSPYGASYEGIGETETRAYLTQCGMPLTDAPADHFGLLLLAASWIEDNAQESDEIQAQIALFDEYLFPWCGRFLGKVEAHANHAFYRTLAIITREALQAMRDELAEVAGEESGYESEGNTPE
ncbi:TorD/DmsD family molecular chaperone [Budvicia aquatica]|uniref:Chaperone protein YcdY n=1 Tax=Budvicia aquatica TaxID=82979 RepID=A0A2C6DKN4_9GAMM|nr:molecular chaperone [Budvicia aquatica]PHI30868.1 molecular chaperone [Budvicia aquatica]GKX53159.1 molecular chaperone [Budvicia aquatica]VFS50715.1 Chaperone protein YcdY [Budvicia aquatica]